MNPSIDDTFSELDLDPPEDINVNFNQHYDYEEADVNEEAFSSGDEENGLQAFDEDLIKEDFEPKESEKFVCAEDEFVDSDDEIDFESDEEERKVVRKLKWPEKVDTIRTRAFIDYLTRKAKAKQTLVLKTREELSKCRDQIKGLEKKRDEVYAEIETKVEEENTAAVFLLNAQHDKLCRELDLETELEAKIEKKLVQAEYQANLVELEQGHAMTLEKKLIENEAIWDHERNEEAEQRLMKEEKAAITAAAQERLKNRMEILELKEQNEKRRRLIKEAADCRGKHLPFLADSLGKIQRAEEMQKRNNAEHLETRIKSVLTLKSDIDANKENLKTQMIRNKARENLAKEKQTKWLEKVESEGINASFALQRQQRINAFNQEKQQFEDQQREQEVEIAEKILREKKSLKKRKKLNPELFADSRTDKSKFVKPLPKKKLRVVEQVLNSARPAPSPKYDHTRGVEADDDSDVEAGENEFSADTTLEEGRCESELPDAETNELVEPEFEGLWDHFKPYKAPKDAKVGGSKSSHVSKMEKEIMDRQMQKLRDGIIIKQVAVGREFKGRAFKSKPETVHFKDFEVGKSYEKRVLLTNISLTLNTCKYTGLTEYLKDFIEIQFVPPGQMSAGLTCDLMVYFRPMINKDLEGEVQFLAQTGPFTIPIICTTKKCITKVDVPVLDFGTSVIGETLKKTVTLTNAGDLPTVFHFYEKSDKSSENAISIRKNAEIHPLKQTNEKEEVGDVLSTSGEDNEKQLAPDTSSSYDASLFVPKDMKVGQFVTGTVSGYSSVRLEIVWRPSIPGRVSTDFVVAFEADEVDEIAVTAVGDATTIPIWVERKAIDLKICWFDRLYQDSIVVHNSASTACQLKFEVCKELRNHLDVLPKSGFIQAQSEFAGQLKFLPRQSLFEEASKFYDKDTGVFEAPVVIHVTGQTLPVEFSVHAVVTSSDLSFDQTNLNFGHCTIHEMAIIPIRLTNRSLLPQEYGFMGCPDFVEVQPNDGFGILLPEETIKLDVIFRPKKADVYKFELVCRTLINREFKINCSGVGVHPLLKLSSQVVQFPATAINDFSSVMLEVINEHTSPNEHLRPAPHIGQGPIAPVGPTSFEFFVPEGVPVNISPQVGTVLPGKKCKVCVRFCPTFEDKEVREEAVRVVTKERQLRAEEEFQAMLQKAKEAEELAAVLKAKKTKPEKKDKSSAKTTFDPLSYAAIAEKGPAQVAIPSEDNIAKNSSEFFSGLSSLTRKFVRKYSNFQIPCYLASGHGSGQNQVNYSVANTVFLEVHCPIVQPQLIVLSDCGRPAVEFGEVSIGQRVVKTITVQNISGRHTDLHGSCLNPEGPFELLNSLRSLAPDQTLNLILSFVPHKTEKFQQVLKIKSSASTIFLTLKGVGVSPAVSVSVSDGLLDMGNVMTGDVKQERFQIMNTSKLNIAYQLQLDSQSLHHSQRMQMITMIHASNSKHKNLVGTQNFSGKQVFDCVPREGTIQPGETQEVAVSFSPDLASEHFRDRCHVRLFGQDDDSHVFDIVGRGRAHNMYISGGDVISPEVETLSVVPELEENEDERVQSVPVLVTLHCLDSDAGNSVATRTVTIGCVKLHSSGGRKGGKQNADWTFDGLQQATSLGFTIDPVKGTVEAGTERTINISWSPPLGLEPSAVASTAVRCIVKGDVTETYKFILKGFMNGN